MAADTAMAILTAAVWYISDRVGEPLRTLFFALGILTMTGTFYAIVYPSAVSNAFSAFLTVGASLFFIVFALITIVKILPEVVSWLSSAVKKR